jgi:hypothetical protein
VACTGQERALKIFLPYDLYLRIIKPGTGFGRKLFKKRRVIPSSFFASKILLFEILLNV